MSSYVIELAVFFNLVKGWLIRQCWPSE